MKKSIFRHKNMQEMDISHLKKEKMPAMIDAD